MYFVILSQLYIVLFLHQTTTRWGKNAAAIRCISYYSYIKPQLIFGLMATCFVVYRTIPTSNHNLKLCVLLLLQVVYRTIPTSNHNCRVVPISIIAVVYRTIPTSNHNPPSSYLDECMLYIVLFLHQTTTSYIK